MAEQKNIGFNKGLVMSPSAGEDGEATVLHNLVVRRGELVNIEQPKVVDDTLQIDGTLMFIHKVQNRDGVQENFVDYVQLVDDDDDETTEDAVLGYKLQAVYRNAVYNIHTFTEDVVKSVCAIGNTLVITAEDGVYYAVWKMKDIPHVQDGVTTYTKEMGYVWLGKDFPDVELEFCLQGTYTQLIEVSALSGADFGLGNRKKYNKLSNYNTLDTTIVPARSSGTTLFTVTLERNKNYRLLFVPTAHTTSANITCTLSQQGQDSQTLRSVGSEETYIKFTLPDTWSDASDVTIALVGTISSANFDWQVHLQESLTGGSDWAINNDTTTGFDAVMGIANKFIHDATESNQFVYPFFVRYALKLYDGTTYVKPSSLVLMLPNKGLTPLTYTYAYGTNTGDDVTYNLFAEGNVAKLLWRAVSSQLANWKDIIEGVSIAVSSPIYSYKQGETWNIKEPKIGCEDIIAESGGHYRFAQDTTAYGYLDCGAATGMHGEATYSELHEWYGSAFANLRQLILPSFTEDEQVKDLTERNLFYIIKDLPATDVDAAATLGNWRELDLDEGCLTTLQARRILPDNYFSLDIHTGSNVSVYNSRLVLSNISKQIFGGYPVNSHTMNLHHENDYITPIAFEISYAENGRQETLTKVYEYGEDEYGAPFFWFYHPSSNAKGITVYARKVASNGTVYYYKATLPLKRHTLLEGAYWFNNYKEPAWESIQSTDVPTSDSSAVVFSYPNRVVQSELYNPFVFPAVLQSEVGSGEIVGMASTTDALSQGQLGQFPMYLFTSEGVWAMSVGSDGSFSGKQPLSRDVCINPQSILQLDKAVTFCTDKGMMLLTGNSIKLISGDLDGRDKVGGITLFGPLEPLTDVLETMNYCHFTKALRKKQNGTFCTKFLYDYQHQLIRVFFHDVDADEEEWNLQWVYDIENGAWSTANAVEVKSIVAGYPHSYIQVGDKVYQYAENKSEDELDGYVLTRPISFGNPLAMKHINDLRLLYWCESEEKHDAMVRVLASNDRTHWYRVNSLREHSAKWWRFAVRVKQTDWDALSGICVDYELTRTNKMR